MFEKSTQVLLDYADLMAIPQDLMPLPVLSDNVRSFLSWGIKHHEKGAYNHFMWMIRPGVFASQGILFAEDPLENYLEKYRLKIWNNPMWTLVHRKKVLDYIMCSLARPWYSRLYDFVQIFGLAVGCDWLQIPGLNICSDTASAIYLIDVDYELKHPTPEEVNHWMVNSKRWQVYGRYLPD